jgi:hypothetical protein
MSFIQGARPAPVRRVRMVAYLTATAMARPRGPSTVPGDAAA